MPAPPAPKTALFSKRTRWNATPNRLAAALETCKRQGRPVLGLTESNPTVAGFEYDYRAIQQALADPAAATYAPHALGLPAARQAVAEYYAERGVAVPSHRVWLTTGSSEGYSHLFRLLADPGDEILSPVPSYPLLGLLADINDVQLVRYPLLYDHGWQLDLDALAAAITSRSRTIVIVSPNNPTGSLLSARELSGLIELARARGLAIIADEVFADYVWKGEQPGEAQGTVEDQPGSGILGAAGAGAEPAVAPPPGEERHERAPSLAAADDCLTFTLNGLSKIAALPQMKLGWIVANGPPEMVSAALERADVIADTYLSVATPVQQAASRLLKLAKPIQGRILERIRQNLRSLDSRLAEKGSPCSRLRAEAGWYAVLRIPNIRSDEEWAVELLEQDGVYVHPGRLFDFAEGGYLVISLIVRPEAFRKGIRHLLQRIEKQA